MPSCYYLPNCNGDKFPAKRLIPEIQSIALFLDAIYKVRLITRKKKLLTRGSINMQSFNSKSIQNLNDEKQTFVLNISKIILVGVNDADIFVIV